jgi:hypothetical protein
MQQAAVCHCRTLDAFTFGKDYLGPAEMHIGGRKNAEALVMADVVVVHDEDAELPFQIPRQVVVLELDAVLQGLVPAFDLSLSLG